MQNRKEGKQQKINAHTNEKKKKEETVREKGEYKNNSRYE